MRKQAKDALRSVAPVGGYQTKFSLLIGAVLLVPDSILAILKQEMRRGSVAPVGGYQTKFSLLIGAVLLVADSILTILKQEMRRQAKYAKKGKFALLDGYQTNYLLLIGAVLLVADSILTILKQEINGIVTHLTLAFAIGGSVWLFIDAIRASQPEEFDFASVESDY